MKIVATVQQVCLSIPHRGACLDAMHRSFFRGELTEGSNCFCDFSRIVFDVRYHFDCSYQPATTQGQVAPVRIKKMKSNEQGVAHQRAINFSISLQPPLIRARGRTFNVRKKPIWKNELKSSNKKSSGFLTN